MDVKPLCLAAVLALAACNLLARDSGAREQAMAMTGGDPDEAPPLFRRYGCVSCHAIPGIQGADATVGPPLTKMARRSYIAGVLPNTPLNMERWIMDPPAVDSLTAMPFLGVTAPDARTIAAYLYTLR
jgi:cytochrome c